MKSAIVKRSIVIGGHKTSVSLENDFWDGLRDIAGGKGITLSALAAMIDGSRDNSNLSSAIRVYVFSDARNRTAQEFAAAAPALAEHGSPALQGAAGLRI